MRLPLEGKRLFYALQAVETHERCSYCRSMGRRRRGVLTLFTRY